MVSVRHERPREAAARERLLDLAYGAERFTKPSARLRAGRPPALSLVATENGLIVGSVRLWTVAAGSSGPALLLGPLAVHPQWRHRGIGSTLVRQALQHAARLRHGVVLLVGDAQFYGRFGFSTQKTAALSLPGLHDRDRLLALELRPGALDRARGLISATSAPRQQAGSAAGRAGILRAA
ncbi:MAG: GNAT family N-acetyltransferase [Xanthobacteraceae bacterium]